ncbi:hypothetical protein Tco_0620489 [Tanacetum coccineum]
MSRNYTLDEDTYPTFLHDDGTEMDLFAFIHVADPTKVKVRERERAEEEARLLDSTVGRVVPLLPIALVRAESELEASMERLFDEGGSADQGDSTAGGSQETEIEIVRIVAEEDVAAEKPKSPRKKRQVVTDVGGSSHPLKKLRSNYGTSSGAVNAGKSPSALRELLASSILNFESDIEVVATLPFVTSSVSATPERESGVPADSITGLNLCTIDVSKRFVISSDSSHHSSTNISGAEGDSIIRSDVVPPVMTKAVVTTHVASIPSTPASEPSTKIVTPVHASMFHDSNSMGTIRPDAAGSSHVLRKELSVGSREVDSESLHDIRDMDYKELFTEFSVGTARQACLSAEVRMRTENCLSERRRLESECKKQAGLLKSRDDVGIKSFLILFGISAAGIKVNAATYNC